MGGLKRMPGRARPPLTPMGVPSARQHAAPSSVPSAAKATAFIPHATPGTATTR